MTIKVAINGMGRIGRMSFRILADRPDEFDIVAVNDPSKRDAIAHLLKKDTVHGPWNRDVSITSDTLTWDTGTCRRVASRDATALPWGELGVDVVLECSGVYRDHASASEHLQAGARKVLISAPAKDPDVTICLGVNEGDYDPLEHHIVSNASCTTNCLAPPTKVIHEAFGIKRGFMTTIHAYTQDQRVLDASHKDLRRARAAAMNIIPTTTGAARAIGVVMPELKGKLDGGSMRVPVPDGSAVDLVVELERDVTVEEVNRVLREAAEGPLRQVMLYSEEPLVSSDIIGTPESAVIDGLSTMVMGGNMVKMLLWYDNEWGYSSRLVDAASLIGAGVPA